MSWHAFHGPEAFDEWPLLAAPSPILQPVYMRSVEGAGNRIDDTLIYHGNIESAHRFITRLLNSAATSRLALIRPERPQRVEQVSKDELAE